MTDPIAAPADVATQPPRSSMNTAPADFKPYASRRHTDAAMSAWLAKGSSLPRKGVHLWPPAAEASPCMGDVVDELQLQEVLDKVGSRVERPWAWLTTKVIMMPKRSSQ